MNVTLHTNKGDITLELFAERVPNTATNFAKLASEGFYNGVKFHRVIKGFMIQGGDPLTKDDSKMREWGTGGPGYKFADEIMADNKNEIGTIAMANSGPDTNGSQFFINTAANNFLDSKHTVFGRVIAGMDVVLAIENTPTGEGDRPIDPVIIKSVTVK
ncbi:MAG: peptidylprolyl isomerase [Candidatus Paceibacterota bacterium]